jgi:PQQ enzyme repeat
MVGIWKFQGFNRKPLDHSERQERRRFIAIRLKRSEEQMQDSVSFLALFQRLMRIAACILAYASFPLAACDAKVGVTTYHYDSLRTGWNSSETTLTASNFPPNFGIVATVQLDDQVDAQPLILPNQPIAAGIHDVVYVATESNSVYAIDASSGQVLIKTNLGPPVPVRLGCPNNGPHLGITGTPVIDLNRQLLFVIAYVNLTPSSSTPTPSYQLHALNLWTLKEETNLSPVTITASHTLVDGSSYAFSAPYQRQRPGLLELNGVVYAGFGSYCDFDSQYSRGWVLGWNASTLKPYPASQLNDTQTTDPKVNPPMFLTSVWMSGFGIASDGTDLYFATGNSDCNWTVSGNPCPPSTTWTGTTHIQESVAQLSSGLTLGGVFTPSTPPNTYALDKGDEDLGSGGGYAFLDRRRDPSLSRRRGGKRWKSVFTRSGQIGDAAAQHAKD